MSFKNPLYNTLRSMVITLFLVFCYYYSRTKTTKKCNIYYIIYKTEKETKEKEDLHLDRI